MHNKCKELESFPNHPPTHTAVREKTVFQEIDVTTLDSPNGAKEFIAGVVDFGSFDIAGNIVDGVQVSALYAVFNGQQNRNFEIETPSGTKLALSGYFSTFGFGEKTTDGLDTFKATIRVSGAPQYTPASS